MNILGIVWILAVSSVGTFSQDASAPWQKWVSRPIDSPLIMATDIKAASGTTVTFSIAGNTYTMYGNGEDTSVTNLFVPALAPNEQFQLNISGSAVKEVSVLFYSYESRHRLTTKGSRSVVAPYKTYLNGIEGISFAATYDAMGNHSTNTTVEVRPDRGFRPVSLLSAEEQWSRDEDPVEGMAPGDGYMPEIGPGRGLNYTDGAFRWAVNMGRLWNGKAVGLIRLNEKAINANLFTAGSLSYTARSTNQNELMVITNTSGSLRQLYAPQTLVDIQSSTTPNEQCILKFYLLSQVGVFSNGVYLINDDNPFVIWRIKNPNASGNYTKAQIIEERASDNRTNISEIQFNSATNQWSLVMGSGSEQVVETRRLAISGSVRHETNQISSGSNVAYKAVETYKQFPWGWELTNVVVNPGPNGLTNGFVYYEDDQEPITYRKMKERWFPGGRWERIYYCVVDDCPGWPFGFDALYALGTGEIRVRPWKDGPLNPDDATLENSVLTYSGGNPGAVGSHASSWTQEYFGDPMLDESMTYIYFKADGDNDRPEDEYIVADRDYTMEGSSYGIRNNIYRYRASGHYLNGLMSSVWFDDYRRDQYEHYPCTFDWATKVFTTNAVYGDKFMSVITHGRWGGNRYNDYDYHNPMEDYDGAFHCSVYPGKATQEQLLYQNGNVTYKKMLVLESIDEQQVCYFAPYSQNIMAYDTLGHLTNTTWMDVVNPSVTRIQYQASYVGAGGKDCDLKQWDINEFGEKHTYAYDSLRRLTNVVLVGATANGSYPAQNDIATNIVYDAMSRVLQEQVMSSSLSQSQMRAYDISGRITLARGIDGVTTNYSYSNNSLVTTETRPGNVSILRSNYLDGRLKSVTGSGTIPEYYDYSITSETHPAGYNDYFEYPKNITRIYYGTNTGPRWVEKISNLYRLLSLERYPGFGSSNGMTTVNISYLHDNNLFVSKSTQTNIDSNGTLYANIENYVHDGYGEVVEVAENDARRTYQDTLYETDGTCWYKVVYDSLDADAIGKITNHITRERLSGFTSGSVYGSITEIDVDNNTNIITLTLNQANKSLTAVTNTPQSTINITAVTINGLLQSQTSESIGTPTRYYYDSLGRLIATKDPLGNITGTSFDPVTGWVLAATNASGQVTSYQYYATNEANAGMVKCQIDPNNKATRYEYGTRGELLHVWGDVPYPEERIYNGYGELVELKTYQGGANWASETWPGSGVTGQSTKWNYHPATGLLLSKTDALGRSVTNNYTFTHNLWTRTSRGITTTYAFNDFGDEISRTYSDGSPNIIREYYNAMGLPTLVTDAMGTRTFVYDAASRLTNITFNINGASDVPKMGWHYDPLFGLDRCTLYDLRSNNVPVWINQDWRYTPTTGRMSAASNDIYAAYYTYASGSDRLATTTFKHNSTTRLTTSRAWDFGYRLKSIANVVGTAPVASHVYSYDNVDRRTRALLADGSAWNYDYNDRNEVVSGSRFWNDFTPVAGQQYGYQYDSIGNRVSQTSGGDASGGNLRTTSYTPNALNQYSQITTPGVKDILGVALAANSVTVDGSTAARKGEYFQQPVNVANTGSALWRSAAVTSGGSSSNCAFAFPKYQTTPTYDLDGNLTFDGVWNYQWDAENRLRSMNMTNITGVPNAERKRLDFLYDDEGRRVMKAVSVWNGSAFANPATNWFVYDGWNLAGELSVTAEGCVELVRSYTWGLDLSGSLDGAGGIGGLVVVTDYATGTSYFPAYDGNGNILALVNAADGSVAAQYEYSPFGELIRSTGTMAKANPFRWSTKYWDDETGLVYYGYRYYSPAMGRWISRDPIEEEGGNNLYAFVANNSNIYIDPDGRLLSLLCGSSIGAGADARNALSVAFIYRRLAADLSSFVGITTIIAQGAKAPFQTLYGTVQMYGSKAAQQAYAATYVALAQGLDRFQGAFSCMTGFITPGPAVGAEGVGAFASNLPYLKETSAGIVDTINASFDAMIDYITDPNTQ